MSNPIVLREHARERGTYIIVVSFKDESGTAVTPSSALWTLTDSHGTVINSRTRVPISSLSTSNTIVLSADDLAILASYDRTRLVLVEYVYDSTYGLNLPDKVQIQFQIDNMIGLA